MISEQKTTFSSISYISNLFVSNVQVGKWSFFVCCTGLNARISKWQVSSTSSLFHIKFYKNTPIFTHKKLIDSSIYELLKSSLFFSFHGRRNDWKNRKRSHSPCKFVQISFELRLSVPPPTSKRPSQLHSVIWPWKLTLKIRSLFRAKKLDFEIFQIWK